MPPEDIESRVAALEGQVQANTVDVAAARELASEVDRDVSEMRGFRRATTASINALRADMVDMRQEMVDGFARADIEMRSFRRATTASFNALRADMVDGFRRVDETFTQVDNGFAEMRSKFDMTAAGQQHIAELIQQVIDRQGGTSA